ncbi:MAG: YkgJ family cysteine cluster protein [Candidatus Auribacterota bacterium]
MGCLQCGNCCRWGGYVHLTDKDIKRIASFLEMEEYDFIQKYTCLTDNRNGLSIIDGDVPGTCVFLESNNCRIYSARPKQCREFPYTWKVDDMTGCSFNAQSE